MFFLRRFSKNLEVSKRIDNFISKQGDIHLNKQTESRVILFGWRLYKAVKYVADSFRSTLSKCVNQERTMDGECEDKRDTQKVNTIKLLVGFSFVKSS